MNVFFFLSFFLSFRFSSFFFSCFYLAVLGDGALEVGVRAVLGADDEVVAVDGRRHRRLWQLRQHKLQHGRLCARVLRRNTVFFLKKKKKKRAAWYFSFRDGGGGVKKKPAGQPGRASG